MAAVSSDKEVGENPYFQNKWAAFSKASWRLKDNWRPRVAPVDMEGVEGMEDIKDKLPEIYFSDRYNFTPKPPK